MNTLFARLDPTDRHRFILSALALTAACLAIIAAGYAIAMPLDSMVVLMVAVIAAGALFALGSVALIWRRFRAMGYPPLPSTIAYLVIVAVAANLLTSRAFEAKLLAIPFVVGVLLPFVVIGRAGKKNPPEPGDQESA